MDPVKISVLHATYRRPEKAVATMEHWMRGANNPAQIEYIFIANADDETAPHLAVGASQFIPQIVVIRADVTSSAPAWNVGSNNAKGKLLVQASDDMFAPAGWDDLLLNLVAANGGMDEPMVIGVSDGYRKDRLCCTAICTTAYRDMEGHFLFPGYRSMFSDDEFTIRAIGQAADGEAKFVEARDLVFKHEHHYHNKDVPLDATYQHQNSGEAYAQGSKLFVERNQRLIDRGFRTW